MANRNHSSMFFTPDLPANTDNDYLQDPALWRDKLPQPFRMIDEAIQDLLMNVFDQIELRKVESENKAHERVIPSVSDATLMLFLLESDMIATVNGEGFEYAISAGSHGISVARLFAADEEKPDDVGVANKSCGGGRVTSMDATFRGGAIFIALSLDHQTVKIFVYKNGTITEACQIEGLEEKRVNRVKLSSGASHLAVTTQTSSQPLSCDDGSVVVVTGCICMYSIPIDQWMQLIETTPTDQLSLTIPTLYLSISPPLSSSPTSDPVQIIKLIQDKSSVTLPVDRVAITDTYLQARRQLFITRPHRRDFVQEVPDTPLGGTPLVQFLNYWGDPSPPPGSAPAVGVIWEKSSSLIIYSLQQVVSNKKGNNNVPMAPSPDRVYLHANYITSLALNDDSTMICVGLESGNLSMYDIKTGITWGVSTLSPGKAVSAVKFAPSRFPQQPVTILCGCVDGSVHCVKWVCPFQSSDVVLNKGYVCSSGVVDIKFCSSLPTTVTTCHDDGCLVVWEWSTDGVPLCSLSLPSSLPFNHLSHPNTTGYQAQPSFATISDAVLAIGTRQDSKEEQLNNGVFCWSLSTCEVLRKTWINSPLIAPSPSQQRNQMNQLMDIVNGERKSTKELNEDLENCWKKLDSFHNCRPTIMAS